jgi:hypothetical protein
VPSRGPRAFAITFLKRAGVVLAILVAIPYAWGPVYRFPDPTKFSGSQFFNPYAGTQGRWLRANLHAHGRAWSGLTNGVQPDETVVQRYRSLGYDVAGVSDYESIAAHRGIPTIPLYEHGYNIGKVHQLAIGARRVEWFDFLLWQSTSQEQYIIDRVGATADLVAIAHPSMRDAYSIDDLQKLSRYQLMEVVNGPFAIDDVWDAALSSGHAVWALANDDTHDLEDPRRTAAAWNMIHAATASTADVIAALREGRTYAVARSGETPLPGPAMDATLARADFGEGRLVVSCAGAPSTFVFIGQNGEIRKTVMGVTSADYTFTPDDSYIRTVIRSPRTTMYLNPVLRYDGARLSAPVPTVDKAATWAFRLTAALAAVLLAAFWRSRRRRRTPALVASRPAVLPGPDRKTA